MGWFNRGDERLRRVVTDAVESVLSSVTGEAKRQIEKLRGVTDAHAELVKLREQIETLKIEKGRKEEEFAKKERETEHKVGLERKRQEFEITASKREATLAVREENLAADRKRFEEQMEFHDKRFTEEVGYLKAIIGQLSERLPSMNISARMTGGSSGAAQ